MVDTFVCLFYMYLICSIRRFDTERLRKSVKYERTFLWIDLHVASRGQEKYSRWDLISSIQLLVTTWNLEGSVQKYKVTQINTVLIKSCDLFSQGKSRVISDYNKENKRNMRCKISHSCWSIIKINQIWYTYMSLLWSINLYFCYSFGLL